MRKSFLGAALVISVTAIAGCAPLMTDDLAAQRAFSPFIAADGTQSFRFTTSNQLPSYYQNADIREVHEQWIANELGRRQYCLHGYEIENLSEEAGMLTYEGVCRPAP